MGIVVQKEADTLSNLIAGNKWYEVVTSVQTFPCNTGGTSAGIADLDVIRYIDFTPSAAGDLLGVILCLYHAGDAGPTVGTVTVELQEDSGGWVTRATKTIDVTDLGPGATNNRFSGCVDFRFAAPYTVTAVAATWRFKVYNTQSDGPDIYALWSENGTDDDHLFHIAYLDTQVAIGANDAVVLVDKITVDQDWTIGAHDSQQGTQTGILPLNRYWSVYSCIPIDGEGKTPQINVPSTVSADTDLEFQGSVLCSSRTTALLVGDADGTPIPSARVVDVHFSGISLTKDGMFITHASRFGNRISIEMYGSPPTNLWAALSESATKATATVKVTGDMTGEWSIGDKIMVGGGNDGNVNRDYAKSEWKEIQGISHLAGVTTITLTDNLLYDHPLVAGIDVPVSFCERNVILRGDYQATVGNQAFTTLYGCCVLLSGVAVKWVYVIRTYNVYTGSHTPDQLAGLESYAKKCHFHDACYSMYFSTVNIPITISHCTYSDAHISATGYRQLYGAYINACKHSVTFEDNICNGRYMAGIYALGGTRNLYVRRNYFSGQYGFRAGTKAGVGVIEENTYHNCRYANYFNDALDLYFRANIYRVIYYLETNPDGAAGCYYHDDLRVNIGIVCEDDDVDDVGNFIWADNDSLMQQLCDNIKFGAVNGDIVREDDRDLWTPGSLLAFQNYDQVAGQTKTWEQDGYLESTGTGLVDTEAHTTGAGRLAWRMNPAWTDTPYEMTFKVPVDVANSPVTVQIWCKLKATAYAAGVHTPPRLTVAGLGATPASDSAAVDTTDWQLLSVTVVPTRRGQMTATLHIKTDAAGTDRYVYWDDIYLAYREPMNLGGMDLQADGFFPELPITQLMTAAQVWGELTADNQLPGSFGELVGDSLPVDSFEGGAVWVDGTDGNDANDGTPTSPVKTLAQARTNALANDLKRIQCVGNCSSFSTDTLNFDHFEFIGSSVPWCALTVYSGAGMTGAVFRDMELNGSYPGDTISCIGCVLGLVGGSGIRGYFQDCRFSTTMFGPTILVVGDSIFDGCSSNKVEDHTYPANFAFENDDDEIIFRRWSGTMTLNDIVHADMVVEINALAGPIEIKSTCTGGKVIVRGNAEVTDNSGAGCTVIDETIQTDVGLVAAWSKDNVYWDNQAYSHTYRGVKYLTYARGRAYDTGANATTHGATGLLYTFEVHATYTNDECTSMLSTRLSTTPP